MTHNTAARAETQRHTTQLPSCPRSRQCFRAGPGAVPFTPLLRAWLCVLRVTRSTVVRVQHLGLHACDQIVGARVLWSCRLLERAFVHAFDHACNQVKVVGARFRPAARSSGAGMPSRQEHRLALLPDHSRARGHSQVVCLVSLRCTTHARLMMMFFLHGANFEKNRDGLPWSKSTLSRKVLERVCPGQNHFQ